MTRRPRPFALGSIATLVVLAASVIAQDATQTNSLTLDKLLDFERVSSPRLSPDGDTIVFTRSWTDQIHDKPVRDLWLVGSDGARPRHLVRGSSARWSPDGTRLAYVAEGEPKGPQIHVMWMDTREATQITRLDRSPSQIRWSPDGTRIAFSMVVPEKEGLKIELPKRPEGAKWAEEPKIVTRLNYRSDRQGYRPDGFRHLFVVDAEGGTERQVTSGDFDHGTGEWTADGRSLVFAADRHEDADWRMTQSDVHRVDVDSGAVTQLTTRLGPDGDPVVSPDGRWVAYTGFDHDPGAPLDTYNLSKVYVMSVDGDDARCLTPRFDRRLRGLMWSTDSKHVLFSIQNEGANQLMRVTVDGEGPEPVTPGGATQFRASHVGAKWIVGVHSSSHQPPDVAVVPAGARGTSPRRVTRVNADVLDRIVLGEVEEIRYPSPADGLEIQGWIVKPPDFDPSKKYPLILQIHGGPHAMYDAGFSFERQNHAANGYVVLYTNPRGSSGYGKAFGMGIHRAYPGKDYDDLMGGVDAVLERGYVDPERMFVYGGSGGGVLTCWIVGHTDRFKAAVSMFPVTNWVSFVGTTDGPYWYTNFAKLPWEDVSEHWDRSPLKYVGNVSTPTMLICGELDLRTPMAQTEEYYQALKLRKVPTMMIRVPGEYHGAAGRRPSNQLRRILYVRAWFERHDSSKGEVVSLDDVTNGIAGGVETSWTGVLDEATFASLHELKAGAAPELRGEAIEVGGAACYLSVPEGRRPRGGVVVIHEWWGLNDHVKHWADRLAADGYAALAVDLYGGTVATSRDEALAAMQSVDEAAAQGVLTAAHRFLAADPRTKVTKRACIGWCFGGGWSLRHAIATEDLDAAVIYYGRMVNDPEVLHAIRAPVLGVFGNQDRGIPPSAVDAFAAAMESAGRELTVLRYDANHAFANPSSARYDADAAEAAWREVRRFLAERL